jgi:N-acetylmuramoyl-L-alanine amidase
VSLPRGRFIVPVLLLALTACGGQPSPSPVVSPSSQTDASPAAPSSAPPSGGVIAAPGSSSEVYAPNPKAITVAIDPGHGGCLDWGVPDPSKRGTAYSEKAMTLGIGLALRDMLVAQGINVVMTRDSDVALAGDDYPQLGCNGPPWRDVDGDGQSGFEESGRVRTRDELQARIDVANLARADVLISIHINSPTQNGVPVKIAFSETYYDDETPWGVERTQRLAEDVQSGVARALSGVDYARQDRGVEARAFYLIARQWGDGDTCETPGDTWCSPHRGLQTPGVLSEVGTIRQAAEQDLLVTEPGQRMVASGITQALATYFADRPLAVRYDALLPGGEAGVRPTPVAGDGPPFVAPSLSAASVASGVATVPIRLTNTGAAAWPAGLRLLGGWQASDAPYLAVAPSKLEPLDADVPALGAGESVELTVSLPVPAGAGRQLAWITLAGDRPLTDAGSPALQLVREGR